MALEAIGYQAFKAEQAGGASAGPPSRSSALPAMSKAPGSVPTRAPRFRCNPTARSASQPESAPRDKDISPVLAQIAAEQLGVAVTDVDVVTGDTDQFYWGAGTFASRGAVVAGNAVNEASKAVRKKALKLASDLFECAEEDLVTRGRQSLDRRNPREIREPRRSRAAGQPDARRGPAGHRAGTGIDAIFRTCKGSDRQRRPCHDRGNGSTNLRFEDPEIRCRA